MEFIKFNTLLEYKSSVRQDLSRHKYQNSIPLQKINKWTEDEFTAQNGLFAAVQEDGQNKAIIFHTPPYPMIVYFADNKFNKTVLEFLTDKLLKIKWNIDKVWSDGISALEFAKKYSQVSGKKFFIHANLAGYRLGEIAAVKMAAGTIRQATQADNYFLPYWRKEFFIDTGLGAPQGTELAHNIEGLTKDNSNLRLFIAGGVPVAMVGANKVTEECVKIGPVYTPPHFRRNGYAMTAVVLFCKELQSNYKDIMLFADAKYAASNACYQKIGFKKLFTMTQYRFE
jgi:hypothetical protein